MKFYILSTEPWTVSSATKPTSPQATRRKSEGKATQTLPDSPDVAAAVVEDAAAAVSASVMAPIPIKMRPSPTNELPLNSGSPVFSDPDSPTNTRTFNTQPSNLSRAFAAAQMAPLPAASSGSSSNASGPKPVEPGLLLEPGPLPPLSSSPSPAFLPARSVSGSMRVPRSLTLTKSTTSYPGKLAYSQRKVSETGQSPAPTAFTYASVGSLEEEQGQPRKPSSRSSHSTSDGISAAARGRRHSSTAQGNPTLSTSFVSSLGRSSGARAHQDLSGGMEQLRASSASIDLLRQFRKAVDQTGDASTFRKR
jgi:hypothetical protein